MEITNGVKHTIGRKVNIVKAIKFCHWLLDGEIIYCRLKSNIIKYTYYDEGDNDTIVILNTPEPYVKLEK